MGVVFNRKKGKMRKKLLLVLLIVAVGTLKLYGQGVIPLTTEEYAKLPKVLWETRGVQGVLPASVYLPSPPVGSQGEQGSCTAWACAYAAMGILGYQRYSVDWNRLARSPAFLYNQTKASGRCDTAGAYIDEVLRFIAKHGVCSVGLMPYDASDCMRMPNAAAYCDASNHKAQWRALGSPDVVDEYKKALSRGWPVVGSILITAGFRHCYWNEGGVWSRDWESHETKNAWHAVCVVGYDDSRQMLKVQNSWGTSGGDNGFFWIPYDMVRRKKIPEAYVVYSLTKDKYTFAEPPSVLCSGDTVTLETCAVGEILSGGHWFHWEVEGAARILSYGLHSVTIVASGAGIAQVRAISLEPRIRGSQMVNLWVGAPQLELGSVNQRTIKYPRSIHDKGKPEYHYELSAHLKNAQCSARSEGYTWEVLGLSPFITEHGAYGDCQSRYHLGSSSRNYWISLRVQAANSCGASAKDFILTGPPDIGEPDDDPEFPNHPPYERVQGTTILEFAGDVVYLKAAAPAEWIDTHKQVALRGTDSAIMSALFRVVTPWGEEVRRVQGDRVSLLGLPAGIYVVAAVVGSRPLSRTVIWDGR